MRSYEDKKCVYETEALNEYRKWLKEIPHLSFKKNWLVKVAPPYAGAVARFVVVHKKNPEEWVSVYLDCYDELASMGFPYWEAYPINGDVARFQLNKDEDEMLAQIDNQLKKMLRSKRLKSLKRATIGRFQLHP